ncbi:1374_t:CDS:2 [Cetraspora pellucida]|uniref:1374_t:CDS:1 n=1 Tax=Cetraspora pellucida TaxID=1433469 RepID=A0A9N8ZDF8_9GLOM|nr:1374_t:CDS:2 [Cetraspora pellucida]
MNKRVNEYRRLSQNDTKIIKNSYLVEPSNHYKDGACKRCLEHVEDGNINGQFDPVREFASKKKDKLSEVKFIPPLDLLLGSASNKIIEWFRKKGEEYKKSLKTYTS